MDYVDVIFAHRPDLETPLEETCRAFNWLIDQGKAFYWGTSEWPADRTAKAIEICERLNLHKPIVEQPEYNMLARTRFEKEYRRLFSENKIGATIWSPLAMGLLSGKYNDGNKAEGGRFANWNVMDSYFNKYLSPDKIDGTVEKFKKLDAFAKELGYTQAQLALAWCIASKDVSTCMLGFSRIEQIDENLKALELYKKWNNDIEKRCEEILGNAPEPDMDWRKWGPQPNRRTEATSQ